MHVTLHPKLGKQLEKLPPRVQQAFRERLQLFVSQPRDPALNVHRLKGAYEGYWSINVTGDVRAVYQLFAKDRALFVRIGTHSQLY